MPEYSITDMGLHMCCIVCESFALYRKDCLMFLSTFTALATAALYLHCHDSFRSSDTSTPKSFSRVTLSSSVLPFPDFILYVHLGIMLPYVHGLAFSSIEGKKPICWPIYEPIKIFQASVYQRLVWALSRSLYYLQKFWCHFVPPLGILLTNSRNSNDPKNEPWLTLLVTSIGPSRTGSICHYSHWPPGQEAMDPWKQFPSDTVSMQFLQ